MARTGRAFPSQPSTGTHAAHGQVIQRLALTSGSAVTTSWGNGGVGLQRQIDPAVDYPGSTVTAYLEVHGKTSDAAHTFQAVLKNVTTGIVQGGSVSTLSTAMIRMRSAGFVLASGSNIYEVNFGGTLGATYTIYDAALIVVLS